MNKKLIIGLSAFGLLGVAGIGFATNKQSLETRAATTTTIYLAIDPATLGSYQIQVHVNLQGDGNNWKSNMVMTDFEETYRVSETDYEVYSLTFDDLYDGLGALQFQITDGADYWATPVKAFDSWTSVGNYNNKLWIYGEEGWNNYTPSSTFAVTKYGVYDGTKGAAIGDPVNVKDGAVYELTTISEISYAFEGWFEDEACSPSKKIDSITVNKDTNVYAKFTSLSSIDADTYIYFVTEESTSTNAFRIYSFGGGTQYGTWDNETSLTEGMLSQGSIAFQGYVRNIYRIPVKSAALDTHIIFRNITAGSQSVNIPLVSESTYWFASTGANIAASTALNFMLRVEAVRDGGSICDISKATMASLYNEYLDIDEDIRNEYIKTSFINTWKDEARDIKVNVSYDDIMKELGYRGGVIPTPSSAFDGVTPSAEDSSIVPLATAIFGSIALGTICVFRKKKEE